ncbi:hypothetical protein KY289_011150 [Solanum tuberosum]|nr:hypothetical protein KY289_011150 [Solanum tuberosum]
MGVMKKLHEKVQLHLEKKNQDVAKRANKRRKGVVFELGILVWVHFCKEQFPTDRKKKLMPRGDEPLPVLERLNDNPIRLPFLQNIKTNSFQEGENDAIRISSRPFTRSQAQDLQRMQGLFMKMEVLEMVFVMTRKHPLVVTGILDLSEV